MNLLSLIIDWFINLPLEIKILWVMNGFALLGALEGCKKKVNLLKMNFLFTIANIYLIYYFISINELPLICLQICLESFR